MNRRQFIKAAGSVTVLSAAAPALLSAAEMPVATAKRLPRWRGFNLTEKCVKGRFGNPPYKDSDFELISDWGFDFVRLPLSYLIWTDPANLLKVREDDLRDIDAAVEMGRKHGVHVNLNLHRAPGYCVNPPKEPLDLWTDEKALEACAFHWGQFAKRYKGVANENLSFDLLNEPSKVAPEDYTKVVKRLVQSIRAEDSNRLVIADGLNYGREPVPGLAELGIAQSTRGYDPMELTHFRAGWVKGSDYWSEPTWPLKKGDKEWNKDSLRKEKILPWKELEAKGVGVHIGEWGAFNLTPHKVALGWMKDCLDLWKEAGWGWALWNLRGGFGVFDSRRADVEYEDFHGRKLDLEMLKLLQSG